MKVCAKCKVEKDKILFAKYKNTKDGLQSYCKSCSYEINKKFKKDNPENVSKINKKYYKANPEKFSEKNKNYYKENAEKCSEKNKKYYKENYEMIIKKAKELKKANREKVSKARIKWQKENPEKSLEYNKNWTEKPPGYQNQYRRNRKEANPLYALSCRIRRLIGISLQRHGYSKKSRASEILGCSYDEFKLHIENQFTDGMNWYNRSEWHIDHRLPIASATTEEELLKLNHYSNLQPLWALDNFQKGSKY